MSNIKFKNEHDLQCMCVAILRKKNIFHYAVPNGGFRGSVEAHRLKQEGVRAGVADLVIWFGSVVVYVEFKTEKGVLSPAQIDFSRQCTARGFPYYTVRSLDDFMDVLETYDL